MQISCFIIGTTLKHRQQNMIETMASIDQHNFPFIKKILSLDNMGGGLNLNVRKYVIPNNWQLLIDYSKGMVKNQLRALTNIDSEWVLYSEDDVLINKMPTYDQLKNFLIEKPNTGIISFTGGGTDPLKNEIDILNNMRNDVIELGQNDIFWHNKPEFANAWYFEFPVMLVRRQIFFDCLNHSLANNSNMQIEQAFTKSYFDLGLHKNYEKYTWCKDFRSALEDYSDLDLDSRINKIIHNFMHIAHNRNQAAPSIGTGYYL